MMPGIGYIGGRLSIVGGYSWPGAVDLIEEWDEDRYRYSIKKNNAVRKQFISKAHYILRRWL
jgi:hypothetical protein